MATTITAKNFTPANPAEQLTATVGAIAAGIRSGSKYPPIILMARDIASRAPGRKDYLAQLRALYDEFLRRWRYTRDPLALEAVCTSGNAIHDLTWGAATGRGAGDCDEATAALGAAAAAIGILPRIVIMAAVGRRNASHVYPEFFIPGRGWIPADPVAFPKTQFGQQPLAAWRQRFDLNGSPIGWTEPGANTMQLSDNEVSNLNQWAGFDLAAYGLAGTDTDEPETMGSLGGDEGNPNQPFGGFAGLFGIDESPAIYAEADIITTDGLALTPVMEMGLADYLNYQSTGNVRAGALARDQFGNVYQFEPNASGIGGFFSSIFKGAKKLVKGAMSVARMAIKKLPGGKYLLKLHDKLHKITMKLVRPLAKFVGPIAAKLAPIAALIPGYGPAISAALYTTGKIANLINKFDIKKDKKGGLKFKSGAQAKAFQAALKQNAAAARVSLKKKAIKPGHIPAGSAAAKTKLKSMGLRVTNPPPALPPAIIALLKSKGIPIPAQY